MRRWVASSLVTLVLAIASTSCNAILGFEPGELRATGSCTDDADCAFLDDGDRCNGLFRCEPAGCVFAADTIVTCDPAQDSPCGENRCDPATGECRIVPLLDDDEPCDDGDDVCTSADHCAGGLCVGSPLAPGVPQPVWPLVGGFTGSLHAGGAALAPSFRWLAPADDTCAAPTYDVEVDDSCNTTEFASCELFTPEAVGTAVPATQWRPSEPLPVSTTPPTGRRYYWRVRACRATSCSGWSAVRYLEVGRVPQDFNGDGYSDLAVSSALPYGATNFAGVAVFLGSAAGLGSQPSAEVTGTNSYGIRIAAADVDANGFADLLVADTTTVHVLEGHETGIESTWLNNRSLPPVAGDDRFGSSVGSAGDVNGDGFADFLVGSSWFDGSGDGHAYLFYGQFAPYSVLDAPDVTFTRPALCDAVGVSCEFGFDLGPAGDLDGDGFADVVIGAPYATVEPDRGGRAYVYLGAPGGPAAMADFELPSPDPSEARFGASVSTSGDWNGDGYSDLAIGAPSAHFWSLHLGGPAGVPLGPSQQFLDPEGLESGLGHSLSALRAGTAGGWATLVGAPRRSAGAFEEGNLLVYLDGATPQVIDSPDGTSTAGFGYVVASAGDVDGDGLADAVVTAPGRVEVMVFRGTASGISPTVSQRLVAPRSDYEHFGTDVTDSPW